MKALNKPELHLADPQPNRPQLKVMVQGGKPLHEFARRRKGTAPDKIFKYLTLAAAVSVVVVVLLIAFELAWHSRLAISKFGLRFFTSSTWDPVGGDFGALPFIYGTLVSSLIALIIAVPLGIGVAIFINEMCPRPLRAPLSFTVELLAAIPSVIYGLWGIFVLVPFLRLHIDPFLKARLGWTGLFTGPIYGIGMLAAGVVLAIMVVPFISSITREVMLTVPQNQREGVLALGATHWEMIRIGILRNARVGIIGGIILGLGRALGETMAVTMVIGNRPEIATSLLAPGYTMASMIANEFSEATGNLYLAAIIEIGLALFLLTLVVNGLARLLVWMTTRGSPSRVYG
ncbi:MAG: phosphate ABC transporter permease subunit PstC [Terriglobales bacterium]